jgi:hypothetical protein
MLNPSLTKPKLKALGLKCKNKQSHLLEGVNHLIHLHVLSALNGIQTRKILLMILLLVPTETLEKPKG